MILAEIFGPQGLIVLVLILVLLFGANQLPKLARSVGEASKEFKKSQQEAEEEAQAKAATPAPLPPAGDDKITLSKAELDALLAEREARARRESGTPPSS
jgi:sec-independent protein translocase protein TatA